MLGIDIALKKEEAGEKREKAQKASKTDGQVPFL
jgi:hypothetical protein